MDVAAWRKQVLAQRAEKDQAFAGHHSPLPAHERARFHGLPYFQPDPRYRFEVALEPADPVTQVSIPRTGGDQVTYARMGTFTVALPDGPARLAAFETEGGHPGELFIPFKDATSGTETYGGGRYLEAHPVAEGRYLVDFNLAYHPFCVYDEAYTCPIPPRENWARFPIRAGERLPAP